MSSNLGLNIGILDNEMVYKNLPMVVLSVAMNWTSHCMVETKDS